MFVGIGIIVVGVGVFIYRMALIPEQIIEQAQEEQQRAAAEAAVTRDRAFAHREIALGRMKAGYIPDPATAFERQLAIDGMAMAFQSAGLTMPDSLRQLLNYLTVDELREALAP